MAYVPAHRTKASPAGNVQPCLAAESEERAWQRLESELWTRDRDALKAAGWVVLLNPRPEVEPEPLPAPKRHAFRR